MPLVANLRFKKKRCFLSELYAIDCPKWLLVTGQPSDAVVVEAVISITSDEL